MMKWLVLLSVIAVAGLVGLAANNAYVVNRVSLAMDEEIEPESNRSIDLPEMTNPKVIITKSERKLEVFDGEELVKTYKIGLGSTPVGDKEVEGDGKTPEGEFYIFTKNPKSSFYLSLGVSYPGIDDAKRGLEENLITKKEHDAIVTAIESQKTPPQKTALGGEIYIHGNGNRTDWTLGCVAMTDKDVKELFDALPVRTPVTINA